MMRKSCPREGDEYDFAFTVSSFASAQVPLDLLKLSERGRTQTHSHRHRKTGEGGHTKEHVGAQARPRGLQLSASPQFDVFVFWETS